MKLKDTGSLTNWLMDTGNTPPKVGEGATVFGWTDRYAYEVESVAPDGKSCVVYELDAKRVDSNGMSEMQEYEYSRPANPRFKTLVFRWGAWREKSEADWREKKYPKISIRFGIRQKYYDFSF